MSEASKAAREAMKKKAHRLADGDDYKGEKIDASGYKVPGEMHTEEKTGEKPKNPRMFKRGGKVEGAEATHHAGKKPRAKRDLGGAAPTAAGAGTAGPMLNLPAAAQAQVANAARTPNPQGMLGSHPVQSWMAKAGGIKKGGRVKKAEGGEAHSDAKEDRRLIDKMVKPEARTGKKEGGKAHKAKGGEVVGNSEVTGTRPTGGRLARADGGRGWKVAQGSSRGLVKAPDYAGALARASQIGFHKPSSVVLDTDAAADQKKAIAASSRLARASGGKASKGKVNVNVIIAQKPDSAMGAGAPMMPPGAPPHPIPPPVIPPASMGGGAAGGMPAGMPGAMPSGMPASMPPMRAAGGRLFPKMDAGGGGAEGRLEKRKEYGNKFAKEGNKGD